MISDAPYTYRVSDQEIFVSAPGDEIHTKAFSLSAPGSIYDSILEEWRVPRSDENVDELIATIRKAINNLMDGLEFGYAQTTHGEAPEVQIDALRNAGIPDSRLFYDKLVGRYPAYPRLIECLEKLSAGDVLVVHEIGRLGRSLKQLADTAKIIKGKKAHFRSLKENIDTRESKYEYFVEHIEFAALFEIDANSARTKAGLKEAAAKGRSSGRRRVLTREKLEMVTRLILDGRSADEVAKIVEVSRATIYRTFDGGLDTIHEANKREGQEGVKKLIEEIISQSKPVLTQEKKEEIIQLQKKEKLLNG